MAYTHIKAHTATSPRRAANTMALVSKSSLACIFAPRVHVRGVFATRAKNLEQKISSSTLVRVRAGKHLGAPPNIDAPYASAADSIAAAPSNHASSPQPISAAEDLVGVFHIYLEVIFLMWDPKKGHTQRDQCIYHTPFEQ